MSWSCLQNDDLVIEGMVVLNTNLLQVLEKKCQRRHTLDQSNPQVGVSCPICSRLFSGNSGLSLHS